MLSTQIIPHPSADPDRRIAVVAGALQTTLEIAGAIAIPAMKMSFGRNEEIFGEEEPADFVYKVTSGVVRTFRILGDGRRQIACFYFAGDLFGLDGGDAHSSSAEAVTDCEIALVRRSQVERAASQNPVVAHALWRLAADGLRRAEEHVMLLGRRSAGERVGAFLLEMAAREQGGEAIDLAMSRTDIADYLGLTIETVSRALSEMERRRMIALPSARHVVLRDRHAFADAA
ncbi:MAG TPA: helix-turn-helix domain-containing protein [Hyphomicrobiales bacterium]|nr:helix-turn-helix domain-containing protein [Hyphomicrobiales bacterium]